ncbi:hypothetical protein RFI_39767 [Reticulomyxa filosa]|uniref:Uncharacterized protein n=1 Tax=Reticulomyxa filosa TaxID=46433 RepID=X6LAK3_RETFI|nr:hypothetical protein RFI_39767 [Reticulomyxa filosa]|eukprot:ETN97759.1 hypothetical protein RFI_39767 [Reticulomyxa filosa]
MILFFFFFLDLHSKQHLFSRVPNCKISHVQKTFVRYDGSSQEEDCLFQFELIREEEKKITEHIVIIMDKVCRGYRQKNNWNEDSGKETCLGGVIPQKRRNMIYHNYKTYKEAANELKREAMSCLQSPNFSGSMC